MSNCGPAERPTPPTLPIRLALAVCLVAGGAFGCITPSEKKGMKDDIYNVQTRLLNIERELTDANKEMHATGDSAVKRIASTHAEIERLSNDIARMHGDLDGLKVGVSTGALPGSDAADETTVAGRLKALSTRLETLEATQTELLETINKAAQKKSGKDTKRDKADKKEAKADGGGKPASGVDDLQKSFDAKHFKQVADDSPRVLKAASAGDKEKVRFVWAESLFKLGNLRDAALKYNDFIEGKPAKKFLPLAKMRLGDCFRHLGDGATAKLYYEELIKEFPTSEEAAKAKERLAEFTKGGGSDHG